MTTVWGGCYDEGWKGLICEEAFVHPAKFSRALIRRIYDHLISTGLLCPGDTVVDPFGGVALGALDALAHDLHWIGCELEPKFHEIGNANLALWLDRFGTHTRGSARLLQGDSRKLCEVIGAANAVVSSPPYAESVNSGLSGIDWEKANQARDDGRPRKSLKSPAKDFEYKYGDTTGQLGGMPAGSVEAVLSSPPYASGTVHDGNGIDQSKLTGNKAGRNTQATAEGYGQTEGQLGSLPAGDVSAVVGSPPFENRLPSHTQGNENFQPTKQKGRGFADAEYGSADGQLGNDTGETFWAAFREIVIQCHMILRPGATMVLVTKDFVRKGQRVSFSADTVRLAESCGFRLVEWIKASLVKRSEEDSLFGGVEEKTVSRKSFFRRLAESKGSPRIDEEDVLVMRREE